MSAFVMSEKFFNRLGAELAGRCFSGNHPQYFAVSRFLGCDSYQTFDRIDEIATQKAQELYNLNVSAVNQRYEETDVAGIVAPVQGLVKWSDIQLMKHLLCLHYQMGEGDVPETDLYKKVDRLIAEIAVNIVGELAEYDKAAWDYQDTITHTVETI